MALIRLQLCAQRLRAEAELAELARARQDAAALHGRLTRASELLTPARLATTEASVITPSAAGWAALAEAEHERAHGLARPAVVVTGSRGLGSARTSPPLRLLPLASGRSTRQGRRISHRRRRAPQDSTQGAARIKAKPLLHEIELLAQRARLDLAPPAEAPKRQSAPDALGLTSRESEVLNLIGRGYTNREIAATLVISVKTASVHFSHILAKLGAPNRREAAAIAHRIAPPAGEQ
jgi:DNA-binding CsgD family transcriptional regulator